MRRLLIACACACWMQPGVAQAQDGPLAGAFEVSAGASWIGSTAFAARDASLTGSGGEAFRLFSTSTELSGGRGFDLRIGRRVTRIVEAGLWAALSSPTLKTRVTSDVENGAAAIASEAITQLTVEVSGLVSLTRFNVGSRVLPFVTAGGGYLRQLHEGETLVQTGRVYHLGAGARMPLFTRGRDRRVKQIGLRADVRAVMRTGGVTIDGLAHTTPEVTASAFVRF